MSTSCVNNRATQSQEVANAKDAVRSIKVLDNVVWKRKPGLFSGLLLGFVVVITVSTLTTIEQDSKCTNLSQSWQQDLD